ncbi:unnamed protein product [Sphenostylis stenocarpa]|uniref:Uncharacterized protein n=1 Tax=Sphenostylis stenocarpa TaxID=92480 RepID=A0AA86T0P5_9FABA|nr:unnamed protein product [Sphenostylis stenocarpa]
MVILWDTVHDNFITNTYNCEIMPAIYQNVFIAMGPTLKIINRFLYTNLIQPAINNGYHKNDSGFYLESFDDKIISHSILDEFLNLGGTPPFEVRNVAGWKKITEQLKQRYILYCNDVCDQLNDEFYEEKDKRFDDHLKKWEWFKSPYPMDKDHPGKMTIYAQRRDGRVESDPSSFQPPTKRKLRCVLSDSDENLIDHIERNAMHYGAFLRYKSSYNNPKEAVEYAGTKVKTKEYPYGTTLGEFLVGRRLLRLFNLSMVYPPKDWEPPSPEKGRKWLNI